MQIFELHHSASITHPPAARQRGSGWLSSCPAGPTTFTGRRAMRFPVVLVVALVCGACFGRGREVTTTVDASRSITDLRNCAVEQLNSLGYTITDSRTTPGAVEGVRPWTSQTESVGYLDRIDVVA